MNAAHQVAREALLLRDWASRVLLRDAPLTPPPSVGPPSWHFFTRMEWCALPLQRRIESAGLPLVLDPAVRAVLEAAAALEHDRIRSARDRLAEISVIARRHHLAVLVLKGGVAAARGVELHLEDIDLAVDGAGARALLDELDPERRQGPWSLGQYRIAAAAPGAVAVEVHEQVRELSDLPGVLSRAQPLPGHDGLQQPELREHLWHLLTHAAITHPDRIGRLRDVLLLRATLADAAPTDLQDLERRIARQREATPLRLVLAMARLGIRDSRLERWVRRRYFLLSRWQRLGRRRALHVLLTSASELTAPPRGPVARRLFERPDRPSAFPGMHALFHRAPRLDSAVRLAFRPAVLLGALGLSGIASAEERFAAGRLPRG